ncbi:MAG: hypothetical protein ABI625_08570, partial [bacterium]
MRVALTVVENLLSNHTQEAMCPHLALLTGNPFGGLFANRYPVLRFGVNFNLPLFGDKTAKAQLGRVSQFLAQRPG